MLSGVPIPSAMFLLDIPRLFGARSMTEMPLGSRIRASGRWAAIGRLLSGVLLLGLHSILARVLSGASYGQYVIIESLALLFSIVCMAGMPYVTLRLARAKLVEGDAAHRPIAGRAAHPHPSH